MLRTAASGRILPPWMKRRRPRAEAGSEDSARRVRMRCLSATTVVWVGVKMSSWTSGREVLNRIVRCRGGGWKGDDGRVPEGLRGKGDREGEGEGRRSETLVEDEEDGGARREGRGGCFVGEDDEEPPLPAIFFWQRNKGRGRKCNEPVPEVVKIDVEGGERK